MWTSTSAPLGISTAPWASIRVWNRFPFSTCRVATRSNVSRKTLYPMERRTASTVVVFTRFGTAPFVKTRPWVAPPPDAIGWVGVNTLAVAADRGEGGPVIRNVRGSDDGGSGTPQAIPAN